MKRKRKNKKGKAKETSAAAAASGIAEVSSPVDVNAENDCGVEELDDDNMNGSAMEVDTPSSTGTDQPHNVANINPDGSVGKGVGKPFGRVTVKLKKPKVMESQLTSSDAPTQSDTDKSSQQMGLEKQGVFAEKTEDSANSSPEAAKESAAGNLAKKTGGIKIKSSKVSNAAVPAKDGSPLQKEQSAARHDKQELDTALMVIKKVMKMDAAEPFNVPVNPVALGIPDYFDVIDTPMDFGTICSNIESGAKYKNSEDVFKDVQYIWDNCFKYNNKGDYILDLMRRVKKNFSKYWSTAGLYSGQPKGADGVEGSQENAAPSAQIKVYVKGGLSKKTSKKGHGRRHKSDCLCAICVLKRRRREREENARIAQGEIGVSDTLLPQELKQEESSPPDSRSGDNSSDMDESTIDTNADAEVEQSKDMKVEEPKQLGQLLAEKEEDEDKINHLEEVRDEEEDDIDVELKDRDNGEATEQFDKLREDANKQSLLELGEKADNGIQSDTGGEDVAMQHEEGTSPTQQQQHKELQEKLPKVRAHQIKSFENPMLLDLCGTLFPDTNKKSIWSGPRSLVRHPSIARTSSIQAAIAMLMK